MKRSQALYIVAGNRRIWKRLPRLAALARKIFTEDCVEQEEKKRIVLTHPTE